MAEWNEVQFEMLRDEPLKDNVPYVPEQLDDDSLGDDGFEDIEYENSADGSDSDNEENSIDSDDGEKEKTVTTAETINGRRSNFVDPARFLKSNVEDGADIGAVLIWDSTGGGKRERN
jgi:hypothetical protein